MFQHSLWALSLALLPLTLSAQAISGRKVSIAVNRSMRAPLPDDFEVQRIAPSATGIWFQGVDHSGEVPEVAVYQWSSAGVRLMTMPRNSAGEALAVTDLSADASGNGYIVADQRLYQAQGSTFQAREDFASFAIRAMPGNWLITASNEIYQLPGLHGRAATRKAEKLGEIHAWSVAPEGALWIAAHDLDGVHL